MSKHRILGNAAWIIGCRIIQAILAVVITMLTARYLGPSDYGLINYASSLVAFLAPIGKLGLDSILVNEIINQPEHEGETLGTAIVLSLISSVFCMLGLAGFVAIANPGEAVTSLVCVLYSFVLLAYAVELTQFWFQAHLLSKYPSLATLVAYIVKSAYQVFLLVKGSSIYWFAITNAFDILLIAVIILAVYRCKNGQALMFSWISAKRMLSQSKHHIVASMMVTIFANTDRIMIKVMIGDTQTGLYSAAVACAGLTNFVFSAIIYSTQPIILEKYRQKSKTYETILTLLYAVVIWLSLLQSVVMASFSPFIINTLYGKDYLLAVDPLRLIVWYTTFSYLGAVRNIWIIANKRHEILWKINLTGALGNILLNLLLIPILGISGAAIASLLTQIITNVVLCFIFTDLKPTVRYMKDAINPHVCLRLIKSLH